MIRFFAVVAITILAMLGGAALIWGFFPKSAQVWFTVGGIGITYLMAGTLGIGGVTIKLASK